MESSILSLDEKSLIFGEIYRITNIINEKVYIGQTVSHRLNKGKYRPFGFQKRFDEHISEALCSKINESKALNNSIRKYGTETFIVELILKCNVEELDKYEQENIIKYSSLFPSGYNLTIGGKNQFYTSVISAVDKTVDSKIVNYNHSLETKALISKRLKDFCSTDEFKLRSSKSAINQHHKTRISTFTKCPTLKLDNDLESYISQRKSKFFIKIGKISTSFYFKNENKDHVYDRVLSFLKELKQHIQIAGNS
jgi:hypothetical protein